MRKGGRRSWSLSCESPADDGLQRRVKNTSCRGKKPRAPCAHLCPLLTLLFIVVIITSFYIRLRFLEFVFFPTVFLFSFNFPFFIPFFSVCFVAYSESGAFYSLYVIRCDVSYIQLYDLIFKFTASLCSLLKRKLSCCRIIIERTCVCTACFQRHF